MSRCRTRTPLMRCSCGRITRRCCPSPTCGSAPKTRRPPGARCAADRAPMASSVVRPAPLPRIGALRAAGGVSTIAIAVRPDISCLLAIGLCAWTFADAVFPAAAPGRGLVAYVATGIVAAGGLITSLVLHEVGHAIVGRWIGLTPRHISLSLFGCVTVFDREPGTSDHACALSLAGRGAKMVVDLGDGLICH